MNGVGLMPSGGTRAAASDHPAEGSRDRDLTSLGDGALGFGLPILWALGHPFAGIDGDAKIYMGRALADLDPAGLGRDLMFANDGQSSFSLFRMLAPELVRFIGLDATVGLLTIASLLVSFVAVAMLARTFALGRVVVMVLAAACVLPRIYAPWSVLAFGEAGALPRPFAEACVLIALAALVRERYALCLASLAGAALLHPIMAAPGIGVLLVVLGRRDWRWLIAAALLAIAAAAAGLSGIPLAARLFVRIDPVWRGILVERTPYLFLHLWPSEAFARALVQAVTILVAVRFVAPRVGLVFVAALLVGWLGVLASLAFGDGLSDLLVLQAQPWRALWLPAALATLAAGLCLWHLPKRGPAGHATLAALCVGWLAIDDAAVASIAAVVAIAVHVSADRLRFGRSAIIAAWGLAAVFAGLAEWSALRRLAIDIGRMPAELVPTSWPLAWPLVALPVLAGLCAWRAWPRSAGLVAPIVVGAGTLFLATAWDVRTPLRRDVDAGTEKPDLEAILATRPGEVLWLDGDEIWTWARRGNWNSVTQGGSIVFSRDLAVRWHARAANVVQHGLASPFLLAPWAEPADPHPVRLDPAAIAAFCRQADAPASIVATLDPEVVPPAGARIWASGRPGWKLVIGDGALRWMPRDRFAIIPCGTPIPD